VRITFDDGDFEDFDKACVVEGLELYKKYKDQDPNPEGVVATVVAAAAAGVDEGGDINIDDDDDDDDDRLTAAAKFNNDKYKNDDQNILSEDVNHYQDSGNNNDHWAKNDNHPKKFMMKNKSTTYEGHDCFSTMTIKELQYECRKREISYSGISKAALIEKLGGGDGGDERVVDDGDVTKDSNRLDNSAANNPTRYRTDNAENEEKYTTTKRNNNNNDDHASDEKESTTTTATRTVDNGSNDDGGELEFSDDGEMDELAKKIMADNDDGNENKEERIRMTK
jgi:hypothetical protein